MDADINEVAGLVSGFLFSSIREKVTLEIWKVMLDPAFLKSSSKDLDPVLDDYQRKIRAFVEKEQPLQFVVIAFPFKAWRNPLKVERKTPDLGEVAMLSQFSALDQAIRLKYAPGTKWAVLTEGSTYRHLFDVPEEETIRYLEMVKRFSHVLGISPLFTFTPLSEITDFDEFRSALQQKRREVHEKMLMNGECYKEFVWTMFHSLDFRAYPEEFLIKLFSPEASFSPAESEEKAKLEAKARAVAIEYIAFNEAKNVVNAVGKEFPDALYISLTKKVGRYAIHPVHRKTRYFPHHGVPIVTRNGNVAIQWLYGIRQHPEKFLPVFVEQDIEKDKPFFYREV